LNTAAQLALLGARFDMRTHRLAAEAPEWSKSDDTDHILFERGGVIREQYIGPGASEPGNI
jgi:hypothetical protein